MLSAIVDYSSTGATYLGLWAHLQQPLATATGIYESRTTVSNKDTNPKGDYPKATHQTSTTRRKKRQPQLTDNKEKKHKLLT